MAGPEPGILEMLQLGSAVEAVLIFFSAGSPISGAIAGIFWAVM